MNTVEEAYKRVESLIDVIKKYAEIKRESLEQARAAIDAAPNKAALTTIEDNLNAMRAAIIKYLHEVQ